MNPTSHLTQSTTVTCYGLLSLMLLQSFYLWIDRILSSVPAQLQDIIVVSDMLCQNLTVPLRSLAHFRFVLGVYNNSFSSPTFSDHGSRAESEA